MTTLNTNTSALRALQEVMEALPCPETTMAYALALVNAAPDLLNELDLLRTSDAVLRGQVARVEEVADTCAHLGMGPLERKLRKALAIPAADISGGE